MNIKAVIFDLDGTLIDSIEGIAYSMNNILSAHGFPVHNSETYKTFIGNGLRVLVKKALPADISDKELDLFHSEMLKEYAKHWDYGMSAYDGIKELLGYLEDHGIGFAVDTNKVEDVSRLIIERFFPEFRFLRVVGSKPGVPHKPDSARALSIAEQAGIEPGECIYLGDSEVDVMTAKNAGMIQVSAAWGFRTVDDLRVAGADRVIQSPMELVQLIEQYRA